MVQISLVYINTLMLQEVLDDPVWRRRMTSLDYRGLSPLIYVHVNPYGRFSLDLSARLPLGGVG